jgi:hypothetical protein
MANADDDQLLWFLKRTAMLQVYVKNGEASVPHSRGTGLFVSHEGRYVVLTNGHVMLPLLALWHAGISASIQVTTRVSKEGNVPDHGIEGHSQYALMMAEMRDESAKPFHAEYRDFGFVEIAPERLPDLEGHKEFVTIADFREDPLGVNEEVSFYGYPSHMGDEEKALVKHFRDVGQDRGFVLAAGRFPTTRVKEVHGGNLILDGRVQVKTTGTTQTARPKWKGISGSCLFDKNRRVAGMLHGGDPDREELYACGAMHLLEYILKNIRGTE